MSRGDTRYETRTRHRVLLTGDPLGRLISLHPILVALLFVALGWGTLLLIAWRLEVIASDFLRNPAFMVGDLVLLPLCGALIAAYYRSASLEMPSEWGMRIAVGSGVLAGVAGGGHGGFQHIGVGDLSRDLVCSSHDIHLVFRLHVHIFFASGVFGHDVLPEQAQDIPHDGGHIDACGPHDVEGQPGGVFGVEGSSSLEEGKRMVELAPKPLNRIGGGTVTQAAVSNWGRWGTEDHIGALNLITPEVILNAAGLIKKGKVYSLAVPLERNGHQHAPFHKTWKVTFTTPTPNVNFTEDVLTIDTHSGTHIDSLGHSWAEGQFYNGYSEEQVFKSGVRKIGIDQVKAIVGRGVMLDIPRYRGIEHMDAAEVVTGEELDAVAASQGVEIQPGDVLLFRTGWHTVFYKDYELWSSGVPGPDGSLAPWLRERDVCAIGADQPTVEVNSPDGGDGYSLLHRYALRDLGVYLLENMNLEEIARDKVYEFMFVGAPLPLTEASGTPWNPVALV